MNPQLRFCSITHSSANIVHGCQELSPATLLICITIHKKIHANVCELTEKSVTLHQHSIPQQKKNI